MLQENNAILYDHIKNIVTANAIIYMIMLSVYKVYCAVNKG